MQEAVNFVTQIIKKVLIMMIQQQMLDENAQLVNGFYRDDKAVEKIKKAFVALSTPVVIDEDKLMEIVKVQFFRVEDSQIVQEEPVMNLSMQTQAQNEWFRACKENDMNYIHSNFKQMKTLRDGR